MLFSFAKSHKNNCKSYRDAEPFKIWPLWWKRAFSFTFLPVCLDLHSKSPLTAVMRPWLFYTLRWKSLLGIILWLQKVDVPSGSHTLDFMEGTMHDWTGGGPLFMMLLSEKTLCCLDILRSSHLDTEKLFKNFI